jgi:molybdenum cofactor cytidylyltransferase
MTDDLAVLLLAAGAGRRFGGIKQLALIDGEPLLLRACALADTVAPDAVHVVLGAHAEAIADRLPASVRVVRHPGWAEGLGSSLAAGIAALDAGPAAVLVLLADQVALTAAGLSALVARWRTAPEALHCACYQGQPGVPAIFPRRLFAELAALRGERGAKPILRREADPAQQLAMPEAAIDIDSVQDLLDWQAARGRRPLIRAALWVDG